MDLGTIHHMAFYVADYERAKEFYVNKLGFRVLGEYVFPNGIRRLDCCQGTAQLEIFWSEKAGPAPTEPIQGYRHLAFRVADIERTAAELEALGIGNDGIRPDPMAGGRMTFFRDPDGLILELHE